MTWKQNCAGLLLVGLFASCATFRPEERGIEALPLPDAFTLYGPGEPARERWWEELESVEAAALVDQALGGNFTLQQSMARLRQAAAAARQAGAPRWPEVGYGGDTSVTLTHRETDESRSELAAINQKLTAVNTLANAPAAGIPAAQASLQALDTLLNPSSSPDATMTAKSYLLGLTASYEVDLWGRVRANHEAALSDFEANREDVHAAMQSLAGQVIFTWLEVLQETQILEVLEAQILANDQQLELAELRYRKGQATALDVYQQRQIVAQTAAQIPQREERLEISRHNLAVLLGKPPRADLGLDQQVFPELGPLPDQGVPVDLLAQRPDVRSAGFRLRAADWQVSAARADRLPALRLTARAQYGADEWDLLFDNWMANLAASVTGPVFDAGRRKAGVERAQAVVEERLAGYQQTVIVAIREVENALVSEDRQRAFESALRDQYEASRSSYREALNRYKNGLNDYLPVLNALTSAQSLERSLVQARHDLIVARVQLHIALGGTWMQDAEPWKETESDGKE